MDIVYTDVTSPKYFSADKSSILLVVKFEHLLEPVDFIARKDDVEKHGSELFIRACAGDFGPIADYEAPVIDEAGRKVMFKQQVEVVLAKQVTDLGFINMADAMTYCDEPAVPKYQQQALALRKWRSLVWAWYDTMVADGKDTDVANFASIPKFVL